MSRDNPPAWLETLNRVASADDDTQCSLPPSMYCSDEVFELEKERIFRAGWVCVARVNQVAQPGDYLALDVVDEPLLIVRDEMRTLRVLSNVCRHRWMQVCAGRGNTKALVCPYHAWTYHLDGRLRGAPLMEGSKDFDPANIRLPSVRHEVWHGFIYVNLDGLAAPLSSGLERPGAILERYGLLSWRVATTLELPVYEWDWKVMQDNGECYHHVGAHRETFETNYPAREVQTECGETYTMQRSPAREEALVQWSDGLRYAPLTFTPVAGLDEASRTSFRLVNVLPNFFIYLQPDYGMNMRMFPLASARIKLFADIIVPPQAFDLADFPERLARLTAFFHRFNDEDVVINTRVQMGLRSRSADRPLLGPAEQHNRHFARWVARRLCSDPEVTG